MYTPRHHGLRGHSPDCCHEQFLQVHVIVLGNTTAGNACRVGTMWLNHSVHKAWRSAVLFWPTLPLFCWDVPWIFIVLNIKYKIICNSVLQTYFPSLCPVNFQTGIYNSSCVQWILQVHDSIFQVQSAQRLPEHCRHFLFLHLENKVDTEKANKQATAVFKGTGELLYQERLESPQVFSLKRVSLMENMIKVYKIMKSVDKVLIKLL